MPKKDPHRAVAMPPEANPGAQKLVEALRSLAEQNGVPPRPKRVRATDAQLAELESHVNAICSVAGEGAKAAWEIGEHYNAIVAGELVALAGEGETRSYLTRRLKHSLNAGTVEKYASVQRNFPKEVVDEYGPVRLSRLLTYLNRVGTRVPKTKEELEKLVVQVPDEFGGRRAKPFPNCSERDLTRATRQLALAEKIECHPDAQAFQRAVEMIGKATAHGVGASIELGTNKKPVLHIEAWSSIYLEAVGKALIATAAEFGIQSRTFAMPGQRAASPHQPATPPSNPVAEASGPAAERSEPAAEAQPDEAGGRDKTKVGG